MKFLVTWKLYPGKLHEILPKFAAMTPEEDQAVLGDVKLVGRWHDLQRGRGAAVLEADDAAAIAKYALAWNEVMDLDITPVLDDEEARAVGNAL